MRQSRATIVSRATAGERGESAAAADLQFPSYLLGLTPALIKEKLTKRRLESRWGAQTEEIDVTLNVGKNILLLETRS